MKRKVYYLSHINNKMEIYGVIEEFSVRQVIKEVLIKRFTMFINCILFIKER